MKTVVDKTERHKSYFVSGNKTAHISCNYFFCAVLRRHFPDISYSHSRFHGIFFRNHFCDIDINFSKTVVYSVDLSVSYCKDSINSFNRNPFVEGGEFVNLCSVNINGFEQFGFNIFSDSKIFVKTVLYKAGQCQFICLDRNADAGDHDRMVRRSRHRCFGKHGCS